MSPCLINIQKLFGVITYPEGKGNMDHRKREIKIGTQKKVRRCVNLAHNYTASHPRNMIICIVCHPTLISYKPCPFLINGTWKEVGGFNVDQKTF
jgi:hypothetical protein